MTSPSYPAALDALANPGPTTETDDAGYELDVVVSRLQNCIMAIEQKLGIGVGGPPASAAVLRRTATGSSGWGPVTAADIQAGQAPVLLASTGVLGAPAPNASFGTINQAFSALEVRIYARSTVAGPGEACVIQYNGDASAAYANQTVQGQGATVSGTEGVVGFGDIGTIAGATGGVGFMGAISAFIHGYSGTAGFRVARSSSFTGWGTVTGQQAVAIKGHTWTSQAPVTSLLVKPATGSFAAGSVISLYGHP